jgi:hypothetical protein
MESMKHDSIPRHFARIEMGYDGVNLDPGQLFTLTGLPNDEKLLSIRHVAPAPFEAVALKCEHCAALFMNQMSRDRHTRARHAQPAAPAADDANV